MVENAAVPQPVQNIHIHIHMDTLSFLGVPVEVISILATFLVGCVQAWVILRGFKQIRKSSEERNKQLDKQHVGQMRQLDAQVGQLDVQKRQLNAQDRKTDILIEHLRIRGQVLQKLLERTAPPTPERTLS